MGRGNEYILVRKLLGKPRRRPKDNYRISPPIRRTFFPPKKCDLNLTCVLRAEGKYYFQTYKYLYIYYTTSYHEIVKFASKSWDLAASLKWDYCKVFQKGGISSALDGNEDDILYEESDASSENNHEDDFSGSDDFLGFYDE